MPWCGTAVSALHQQWGWCGLAAGHQHWSEIYLQSAPVYYLHLKYGVYWTTLVVVLHLWILHLKMVFLSCFNPGVQGCTLQYCFMTLNDVHYSIKIAAWESAGTRKIKSRWPDVELRCPHCTNNGDQHGSEIYLQSAPVCFLHLRILCLVFNHLSGCVACMNFVSWNGAFVMF